MHSKTRRLLSSALAMAIAIPALTALTATPAHATGTPTVEGFENMPNTGFGGDNSAVLDNGFGDHFLQTVRGDQCWSGTTIESLSGSEFISSGTSTTVTASLYAPIAGVTVKLKVEDSTDRTKSVETDYTTTGTGWQLATWDFTNQSAGTAAFNDALTYNKASIFYDFNCAGSFSTGSIWKLDNLTYSAHALSGSSPQTPTVEGFENMPNTGFGGDNSAVLDNGFGDHFLQTVRGDQCWSGTTIESLSGSEFISSGTSTTVTASLYAPIAGVTVKLKVEDSTDRTKSVETDYTTTGTGWQLATWDFTNQSAGTAAFNDALTYNKASIFYDFNCAGSFSTGSIWKLDNLTYTPNVFGGQQNQGTTNWNIRLDSADKPAGSTFTPPGSWTSWNNNVGRAFTVRYLDAGASYTLHYTVTDADTGLPAANTDVELHVATPDGNVSYTTPGLTGTTDQNGQVSFTVNNTNQLWDAENIRQDPASAAGYDGLNMPQHRWDFEPTIVGQGWDSSSHVHADWLWGHLVSPSASTPPCYPTGQKFIRLIEPTQILGTNAYDATPWVKPYITSGSAAYLQYLPAGSNLHLVYAVQNSCGSAIVNQPVQLKVNANWSCSNATYTVDGASIPGDNCNGTGETLLAAHNSDLNGYVSFDLTNTNAAATAEPAPDHLYDPPSAAVTAAKQEVKTNIQPYIDGKEAIDLLFAHFLRAPKLVVGNSATAVKGTSSPVTALVTGSNGKPVSGATVTFKVSGAGTLTSTSAVTNSSGLATTTFKSSASDSGSASLEAAYTDAFGDKVVSSSSIALVNLVPQVTVTPAPRAVKLMAKYAVGKAISLKDTSSGFVYRFSPRSASIAYTIQLKPGTYSFKLSVDDNAQLIKVTVK